MSAGSIIDGTRFLRAAPATNICAARTEKEPPEPGPKPLRAAGNGDTRLPGGETPIHDASVQLAGSFL